MFGSGNTASGLSRLAALRHFRFIPLFLIKHGLAQAPAASVAMPGNEWCRLRRLWHVLYSYTCHVFFSHKLQDRTRLAAESIGLFFLFCFVFQNKFGTAMLPLRRSGRKMSSRTPVECFARSRSPPAMSLHGKKLLIEPTNLLVGCDNVMLQRTG